MQKRKLIRVAKNARSHPQKRHPWLVLRLACPDSDAFVAPVAESKSLDKWRWPTLHGAMKTATQGRHTKTGGEKLLAPFSCSHFFPAQTRKLCGHQFVCSCLLPNCVDFSVCVLRGFGLRRAQIAPSSRPFKLLVWI